MQPSQLFPDASQNQLYRRQEVTELSTVTAVPDPKQLLQHQRLNGICLNPKFKLLMIIVLCIHCIHKDKSFLIKAGRQLRTEKKQKENTSKIPLTLHSSRIRASETFSPFLTPICPKESMNSSELASCLIQDLLCVTTLFFRQTTQNAPKI